MKIDRQTYCDFCCVELRSTAVANRTSPPSVPALFGDRLCESCDNAIVRKAPAKIPMEKSTARYIRAIESGKRPAPFTMSVHNARTDITHHLPIKLTLAGKRA